MNPLSRGVRLTAVCLLSGFVLDMPRLCSAQTPHDVRGSHWAARAVEQVLSSGVMHLEADHEFHGEAHVTRRDAVIALATLTKQLETGTWKSTTSKPIPDKVSKTLSQGAWETRQVTRFELASVLSRFANYYARAVPRPKPGAKDLAKSRAVPTGVVVPGPVSNPAYASLKYLTEGHMIQPTSPLLKADTVFLKGVELSQGIAEAAAGLTDRLTELGLDADGSTPDASFHKKKTVAPGAGR